jgi:hypothetical protein
MIAWTLDAAECWRHPINGFEIMSDDKSFQKDGVTEGRSSVGREIPFVFTLIFRKLTHKRTHFRTYDRSLELTRNINCMEITLKSRRGDGRSEEIEQLYNPWNITTPTNFVLNYFLRQEIQTWLLHNTSRTQGSDNLSKYKLLINTDDFFSYH